MRRMKYKIAEYLTQEQIDTILSRTYDHKTEDGFPVCADGLCPLGVVTFETLKELYHTDEGLSLNRPGSGLVATALTGRDHNLRPDITAAAYVFIDDWDSGRITNLAEALGR